MLILNIRYGVHSVSSGTGEACEELDGVEKGLGGSDGRPFSKPWIYPKPIAWRAKGLLGKSRAVVQIALDSHSSLPALRASSGACVRDK